jgi:hypothetical protein
LAKPNKPAVKKRAKAPERPQRERFEQFAREHGATEDVLDKALSDVEKAKKKGG